MSYTDDEYDDYQSEYELGLEGEYDGDPPPGYESWAEWHYEHGDELPTDEDYGIFFDGDEQTTGYQPDEMAFDYDTGIYYNRRTGKRYHQRELDAESDSGTKEIIALAKRMEAQNKSKKNDRENQFQSWVNLAYRKANI